ncbi:OmpA family protein [Pedobacter mucosus]|uniref:OmpA family protein n=1 Tax=Pedobacter mucosus TaxID=2895286 RepID=UPI001EE4AD37|nr:OmpA family protein [Pedobacter mucosus]UKT62407.1 OmpA family protein [Pedobacter mucosus]
MKTKSIIAILPVLFLFFLSVNSKTISVDAKASKLLRTKAILAALTKNLEYDFNKPSIRGAYYTNLNKLADEVKENNYALSLSGHTDSIGRYKYNWVLSDKRANSIKEYLVSKGVKADRIVTTPFGSTVPIATNKTAAGRQKNRRVEIAIKEMSK